MLLGTVYAATLAPSVTFWDAGEFIAAVHSFGIPHPPGTPLYVLLARAWRELVAPLATALATNLFSALCTALAGGALAWFLARAMRDWVAALAAALCAGAMSTAWLNANETEVYAASLLLAMTMLLAASRTGETSSTRWTALTAYLITLAVPLHLSALVAAPAAIVLAARDGAGGIVWRRAAPLTAVTIVAAGAGLANAPLAAAGVALLLLASFVQPRGSRLATAATSALVIILALSVLAMVPIRAAHDPAINAGDPVSWHALWDVVGRRQYGTQPTWPRQAPLWAQMANWFEYADWQVALGLSPGVAPSWLRTPITLLFAALGLAGACAHRRADRRSWRAFVMLIACASVGLVVYMNFKAGASFGYGVLPDSVPHEVRDRDYFFTLAFWVWGAWAGVGAVTLARALRTRLVPAGLLVAALPIALNWRAADRRREPEASTARRFAAALLWSVPPHGVLVTGGDNDSFPLWYAQVVEHMRPDVTVVTASLLGAAWYRAQLARRDTLLAPQDVQDPEGEPSRLARIIRAARTRGRPVAVAITAGAALRDQLGGAWTVRGLAYVQSEPDGVPRDSVDTTAARAFVAAFGRGWLGAAPESTDPAPGAIAKLLSCPGRALDAARTGLRADSLDSECKWR